MASRLKARLADQIDYLEASTARFDAGWHSEANRMATCVRALVHDTSRSQSLYTQLGIKEELRWLKSDGPQLLDHHRIIARLALVRFGFTFTGDETRVSIEATPQEDMLRPAYLVDFSTWWSSPVMVTVTNRIDRRAIVLALANLDGGAHVDPDPRKFDKVLDSMPRMLLDPDDPLSEQFQDHSEVKRRMLQTAMRTIAEETWLGFNNQLEIIDPEGELPRHRGGRIGPDRFR